MVPITKAPVLHVGKLCIDIGISKILIDSGFQIVTAESTSEVVRHLEKTHFCLVLLELDLSLEDLLLCVKKLRSSFNKKTPVVGLLRGDRENYDEKSCLQVGLHDYIKMPTDAPRFTQVSTGGYCRCGQIMHTLNIWPHLSLSTGLMNRSRVQPTWIGSYQSYQYSSL